MLLVINTEEVGEIREIDANSNNNGRELFSMLIYYTFLKTTTIT